MSILYEEGKSILQGLPIQGKILFMAMMPVIELRGAIPYALVSGLSGLEAFGLSLLGSMIPVPFILFFIRPITDWMRSTRLFKKFIHALVDRTMKKEKNIKKYGLFGLFILVALPLPGTGVWSGSFLASLLNIRIKKALPVIFLGDLMAGILVLSLSTGIKIFI